MATSQMEHDKSISLIGKGLKGFERYLIMLSESTMPIIDKLQKMLAVYDLFFRVNVILLPKSNTNYTYLTTIFFQYLAPFLLDNFHDDNYVQEWETLKNELCSQAGKSSEFQNVLIHFEGLTEKFSVAKRISGRVTKPLLKKEILIRRETQVPLFDKGINQGEIELAFKIGNIERYLFKLRKEIFLSLLATDVYFSLKNFLYIKEALALSIEGLHIAEQEQQFSNWNIHFSQLIDFCFAHLFVLKSHTINLSILPEEDTKLKTTLSEKILKGTSRNLVFENSLGNF